MPAVIRSRGRRRTRLAAAVFAGIVAIGAAGVAIVAVGMRPTAPLPIGWVLPQPDPAPWVDIRWERLDPPAMGGDLTQSLHGIVRGGPGFAVIGSDARGTADAQTSMAAVWVSGDGRHWTKSRLLAGVANGDTSEARLIAAMPGALVVHGGVCCGLGGQQAMWWSSDGLAWERLVLPLGMQGVSLQALAGGPDGFVGVGLSGQGNPNDPTLQGELWTSPDGRAWTEVDPVAAEIGVGVLNDVAWTGTHWLAVGNQAEGETWDGAVWRSPNLTDWSRVADDDPLLVGDAEVELHRVVPFAGGILAAGGRGTHEDRVACEQGGAVLGEPDMVLAYSCGWLRNDHLWSADGLAWRRLEPIEADRGGPDLPPGPGGRRLISHRVIAPGGPGLVVVDAEAHEEEKAGDLIGTWTSVDGDTWLPVGHAPQLPVGLYLNDIVVVDRTIVGIGEADWDQPEGPDAVVWIGTVLP